VISRLKAMARWHVHTLASTQPSDCPATVARVDCSCASLDSAASRYSATVDSADLYRLVVPVREILMQEWDPIGVAGIPDWPTDEYDSYLPSVLGLLQKGASVDDVAAHLDAIATGPIGMKPDKQRSRAAATALLAMWESELRRSR
jgi:hypothetical protein